jgi:hypothetical protein
MAAAYLDDYVQELRSLGEVAFRRRHGAPVLIVTGRVTRARRAETGQTTRESGLPDGGGRRRRGGTLALVHRVFPIVKGAPAGGAPARPVFVGRTADNDVVIPELSISKRHCAFDLRGREVTISDCGSTNGTKLNGVPLDGGAPVPLCGGETVGIGRFTFVFETPAGFLELVSGLAK